MTLPEYTTPGLHNFLVERVLPQLHLPGRKVCDLGAGSGALGMRLLNQGYEVTGVDMKVPQAPPFPFLFLDLNEPGFSRHLGKGKWDLVLAVEVMEHLVSPLSFLKEVRELLRKKGMAVMTTPNLGNLPARLQFLRTGALRYFDSRGDPTHISPVFLPLFKEKLLPGSGLAIVKRFVYPPRGYVAMRPWLRPVFTLLSSLLGGGELHGDNLILVLQRVEDLSSP